MKKLIKGWKKDPDFVAEYDALGAEFARAHQLIAARTAAGLTQTQVAQRMKTTQPMVARIESGKTKPSYRTLEKYARAVGCEVKIELVPLREPVR